MERSFEQGPHTLADFIQESLGVALYVQGLPEGIEPKDAAEKFGKMDNIQLKPYPFNATYFGAGWFPRPVRKDDDTVLFTITGANKSFGLKVEPPALELLASA